MPHHNAVAENVLGTMGTVCWTIQLVPQVWKSYRSKDTEGLSHWFMLIWGFSGIFLGAYAIIRWLSIPLVIQPQLFAFLCFLCWGQCQYYGLKRSRTVSVIVTLLLMTAGGVLEYILFFAIKSPNRERTQGMIGIMAAVLLSVGLLPQYWEIYKLKEVIGVSIPFLLIDILGGVLSVLSLAFRENFDVVASMCYTLVIVLDGLIVILALILNPLARRRRARQVAAEMQEPHTRGIEQDS